MGHIIFISNVCDYTKQCMLSMVLYFSLQFGRHIEYQYASGLEGAFFMASIMQLCFSQMRFAIALPDAVKQ